MREYKGNSLLELMNTYVVLDIETTGLDPAYDEIIEIAALKVNDDKIIDSFDELIKPEVPISEFITNLTGITNDMVKNAPKLSEILPKLLTFIGDNIILGHNINFDINFIYDNSMTILNKPLRNDFIDTYRLTRILYRELSNHKLDTICKFFNIDIIKHHRAIYDCEATYEVYKRIKQYVVNDNVDIKSVLKSNSNKLKASEIKTNKIIFDESHILYGKNCVFTGALRISRKEAMQLVVDHGGYCQDNISSKTNFLILGESDYRKRENKSSKHLKAEEYILEGKEIFIIPENIFLELVNYSNNVIQSYIPGKDSEDCFIKNIDILIEPLKLNYTNKIDYENNEPLSYQYRLKGVECEKNGDYEKAIEMYEQAVYYCFIGCSVYDRLIILYKKYGQENKIKSLLRFAIFVFYKLVDSQEAIRNPRLKKYYDKYIQLTKN